MDRTRWGGGCGRRCFQLCAPGWGRPAESLKDRLQPQEVANVKARNFAGGTRTEGLRVRGGEREGRDFCWWERITVVRR